LWRLSAADGIQSAFTQRIVNVARTVSGQARDLDDGEESAFDATGVGIQQTVQPLRCMVRIDCFMNASVKRDPSPNATESPGPRAGSGDAGRNPVAQRDLFLPIQMLEGCRKTNHLIETFRLNALEFWLTPRLNRRKALFEVWF
jgi:hypothetical protein